MDDTYLQARITAIEAMIAAYEAAITAIATQGIESYVLDTGQTQQRVTKLDLAALTAKYNALLNLLTVLQARLSGNQTIVRPGF